MFFLLKTKEKVERRQNGGFVKLETEKYADALSKWVIFKESFRD